MRASSTVPHGGGWSRTVWIWGALLAIALAGAPVQAEEEYVLGPEDVISVTVWEHPELSRTLAVRANGVITIPPLGDIPAAGKATSVLARDLEREFYNVLRQTTQVTVSVVAFNSQRVFLAGQVAAPGRYSFETIPGLVDLLGQAGGLGPTADLSRVRILRSEGEGKRTLEVDLTRAIQSGDASNVPGLQPEDVIFVPPVSLGGAGGAAAGGGLTGGNFAYILGTVGQPGAVPAGEGVDLFSALALAGGVAPEADLSRIDIISNDAAGGTYRLTVDLENEVMSGRGGPEIQPGDRIRVYTRPPSLGAQAVTAAQATLGASRDLLNLILVRDIILGDDNSSNNSSSNSNNSDSNTGN